MPNQTEFINNSGTGRPAVEVCNFFISVYQVTMLECHVSLDYCESGDWIVRNRLAYYHEIPESVIPRSTSSNMCAWQGQKEAVKAIQCVCVCHVDSFQSVLCWCFLSWANTQCAEPANTGPHVQIFSLIPKFSHYCNKKLDLSDNIEILNKRGQSCFTHAKDYLSFNICHVTHHQCLWQLKHSMNTGNELEKQGWTSNYCILVGTFSHESEHTASLNSSLYIWFFLQQYALFMAETMSKH